MSPLSSRHIVLASHIPGRPEPEHFRLEPVEVGEPGEGELRVRTLFASVDPGTLARLGGVDSYAPALKPGEVIGSATVGEVLDSRDARYAAGDVVAGGWGWREHAVVSAKGLRKVERGAESLSAELGVLGIPGLTAYFGILELGRPKEGETVLVSSAAGAVGSIAGQVAKRQGARVVGIAGGAGKCRWVKEALGFDAVIDYRAETDWGAAIRRECPRGVDVYLDNVGGTMLDATLTCMALRGRVVVSGLVADYGVPPEQRAGLKNTPFLIIQRLRMEGFVVLDYSARFGEARTALRGWLQDGTLKHREHVADGLESAPALFAGLFRGENFGRAVVRVG
ncbi:NADP-dependent oxidoreductase [Myxococcus sp. K38C18041901]|uniref:NADP-dependent oxidoreductase n=1 Tax=Myxococcus guangdongensis TaxID=2906760 RepID=UPI0020A7D422|nr:NADP-dependent oxidoreductase [Myxococcus guangdongensis]MCP3058397.1 NADP-dependent oxidoreductase [Myxococcus guangdongensis]